MKFNTGISVRRVNFSDPQGGKGACDRKAAFIKAHVHTYVNGGRDVQNAQEFKTAILSNGSVTGMRVALVIAAVAACELPQVKLDGVSMLSDFEFSSDALTVWRGLTSARKSKEANLSFMVRKRKPKKVQWNKVSKF